MTHSARFPNLTGRLAPWLILAALGTCSFVLSCRLSFALVAPGAHAQADITVADQMLGAARVAFGTHFLEAADIYYHAGGTGRLNDSDWPDTWFRTLSRQIVPREYRHIETDSIAEMAPMLWVAMRADPHNIETYLIAAYWFATSAGLNQPELAHEVLREGRRRNPLNYRIRLEQALLFLREGRLADARQALDSALALWPSQEDPDSDQARQGKIYALTYRALLHESDNQVAEAIALWKQLAALQPDQTDIEKRLALLKSGAPPPVQASSVWQRMLRRSDLIRAECNHDHHHDHHHHNP